jgi:hypothetical protein
MVRGFWGMDMQSQVERRTSQRFPLCLPVVAKLPAGGEVWTQTRNLSSSGICFGASNGFAVGSALEFVLTLPTEVTFAEPVRIVCSGRVVRVGKNEDGTADVVAGIIDDYEFLVPGEGRWTTQQAENCCDSASIGGTGSTPSGWLH